MVARDNGNPSGGPEQPGMVSAVCVGALLFYIVLTLSFVGLLTDTLQDALAVRSARGWRAVPCTIVSCANHKQCGETSDGMTVCTYTLEMEYHYETRDGRHCTGDRYHLATHPGGSDRWIQSVVSRYPPGTETECYVNPEHPCSDSVVFRGMSGEMLMGVILFPAMFVVASVGLAALCISQPRPMFSFDEKHASPIGSDEWVTRGYSAAKPIRTVSMSARPRDVESYGSV